MPYAVALVIAGLVIGLSNVAPHISLAPDLVLTFFLPPLLFEAAWNLNIQVLKRDWLVITALATIGVIICMFTLGGMLYAFCKISMSVGLLLGAMLAATDPVSVIALFRKIGIDQRLTLILEGESLLNDGTAVVAFQLVLFTMTSAGHWSVADVVCKFFLVIFGGAMIGAFLGYVSSLVTSAFDDCMLETSLTIVTAYGSYLIADYFKVSSIIAVVAAGIVIGNYGRRIGMSPDTRLAVNAFWEYAAFMANSLLFLLIGLQIKLALLANYAGLITVAVLAAVIARLVAVYGICYLAPSKRWPIPTAWRHLLFWGGVRGGLAMALALSLPSTIAHRGEIINTAFGVVLLTLLVPGLTLDPLIRFLRLAPGSASEQPAEKVPASICLS